MGLETSNIAKNFVEMPLFPILNFNKGLTFFSLLNVKLVGHKITKSTKSNRHIIGERSMDEWVGRGYSIS